MENQWLSWGVDGEGMRFFFCKHCRRIVCESTTGLIFEDEIDACDCDEYKAFREREAS
jgi:hypothetical protein